MNKLSNTNQLDMFYKLKLEHITPYLPYGIKCQTTDKGKIVISELNAVYSDNSYTFMNLIESEKGFSDIKPILKPMDQFKGVYITELIDYIKSFSDEIPDLDDLVDIVKMRISTPLHMNYFIIVKLLEWHFDVFGLIDKGLAIVKTDY